MTRYKLTCKIRTTQIEIDLEDFHKKEDWENFTEDKQHSLLYDLAQDLLEDYIDYSYEKIEDDETVEGLA